MKTQVKTKGVGLKLAVGLAVFVAVLAGVGGILYFSGVIAPEELIIAPDTTEITSSSIMQTANTNEECKSKTDEQEKRLCILEKKFRELKDIGFTYIKLRPSYDSGKDAADLNKKAVEVARNLGFKIVHNISPADYGFNEKFYPGIFNNCTKEKFEEKQAGKPGAQEYCQAIFDVPNFNPWHCPKKETCDVSKDSDCKKCKNDSDCSLSYVCNKNNVCVQPYLTDKLYSKYPHPKVFDPSYQGNLWQEVNLKILTTDRVAKIKYEPGDLINIDFEVYEAPWRVNDFCSLDPTLSILPSEEFLDKAKRLNEACPKGLSSSECYLYHWKERGKDLYNAAKEGIKEGSGEVKNVLIAFYGEYAFSDKKYKYTPYLYTSKDSDYCSKVAGPDISCKKIENNSEIKFQGNQYILAQRQKTISNDVLENSFYMPPKTGDIPNPSLYIISSLDAFDMTLQDLELNDSLVYLSFSYLVDSISKKENYPCVKNRFVIKSEEYAQYVGYQLRQAGAKGVIFYGASPFQLGSQNLNWGYSGEEWEKIYRAFIKGFKENKKIAKPELVYNYEDFKENGEKDSCMLTVRASTLSPTPSPTPTSSPTAILTPSPSEPEEDILKENEEILENKLQIESSLQFREHSRVVLKWNFTSSNEQVLKPKEISFRYGENQNSFNNSTKVYQDKNDNKYYVVLRNLKGGEWSDKNSDGFEKGRFIYYYQISADKKETEIKTFKTLNRLQTIVYYYTLLLDRDYLKDQSEENLAKWETPDSEFAGKKVKELENGGLAFFYRPENRQALTLLGIKFTILNDRLRGEFNNKLLAIQKEKGSEEAIKILYQKILDRIYDDNLEKLFDEEGVKFWLERTDPEIAGRDAIDIFGVKFALSVSKEYQEEIFSAIGAALAKPELAYQIVLKRGADKAGAKYLEANFSLTKDQRRHLALSEEYDNRLYEIEKNLGRTAAISEIYETLYVRPADIEGVEYWNKTGLALDILKQKFLSSDEFEKVIKE
ncbi:MAG: hypothetical protein AB1465_01470 [Patescibacteria group bacterium]